MIIVILLAVAGFVGLPAFRSWNLDRQQARIRLQSQQRDALRIRLAAVDARRRLADAEYKVAQAMVDHAERYQRSQP